MNKAAGIIRKMGESYRPLPGENRETYAASTIMADFERCAKEIEALPPSDLLNAWEVNIETPWGPLAPTHRNLIGEHLYALWCDLQRWSEATFGADTERGPIGALKHLSLEALEAVESPDDPFEYADCLMLILDAARRNRMGMLALIDRTIEKLQINKTRDYPKPLTDHPSEHVRINAVSSAAPVVDGSLTKRILILWDLMHEFHRRVGCMTPAGFVEWQTNGLEVYSALCNAINSLKVEFASANVAAQAPSALESLKGSLADSPLRDEWLTEMGLDPNNDRREATAGIDPVKLRAFFESQRDLYGKYAEGYRKKDMGEQYAVTDALRNASEVLIEKLARGDFNFDAGPTDTHLLNWLFKSGAVVMFDEIVGKYNLYWPFGRVGYSDESEIDGPQFDTAREAVIDAIKSEAKDGK